jgi:hypothetical protein
MCPEYPREVLEDWDTSPMWLQSQPGKHSFLHLTSAQGYKQRAKYGGCGIGILTIFILLISALCSDTHFPSYTR